MILRHIAENLKNKNWTALMTELVANREVRNGYYLMVDTHNDWVEMHKRIVAQLEKADQLLSAQQK